MTTIDREDARRAITDAEANAAIKRSTYILVALAYIDELERERDTLKTMLAKAVEFVKMVNAYATACGGERIIESTAAWLKEVPRR